jgi:hypothetical protein
VPHRDSHVLLQGSHAWAEVFLENQWYCFDVSNQLFTPKHHIYLAVGRDYLHNVQVIVAHDTSQLKCEHDLGIHLVQLEMLRSQLSEPKVQPDVIRKCWTLQKILW